jgi:hypothetical protein
MGVPLAVASAPQSSQGAVQPVRRRPVVVWSLLATALLLFLIGASWLSRRTDDARLRRFVAEQTLRATAPVAQPPLFGESVPESSALGYAAAAAFLRCGKGRNAVTDFLVLSIHGLGADPAAVLRELQPVLLSVRRATHATAAGLEVASGDVAALQDVLRFASDEALKRGDGETAVCAWLDEARMACDGLLRWPNAYLSSHWNRWSPVALAGLDTAALRLLAAGLERLEAQLPRHCDVASQLAGSARYWLDKGRSHHSELGECMRAWRRGFDVRAEALATCEMLLATLPAMSPPANDWPARERQWHAFLDAPIERCAGDALMWMAMLWDHDEPRRFAALARLRLLRLAVAFTLGDELPALADPFAAAPLQVEIDGDEATFRSASSDPVLMQRAVRR